MAYMFGMTATNSEDKRKPFTPKSFPERAIDVIVPVDGLLLEIFFNPKTMTWDSRFNANGKYGKLSPEQMDCFFRTEFFKNVINSVKKKWPAADPFYSELLSKIENLDVCSYVSEDDLKNLDEDDERAESRPDLANKDVTGDGQRDYTSTGRKIMSFSDSGVSSKGSEYYCWPRKGKEYKWNSWKDWTKIKPFCKMTFKQNGRKYMISLSLFDENFKNRGFRGADVNWEPPFAWLTPGECAQVMDLMIVRKFLRQCITRVNGFINQDPKEIYEKIDKKDRVTVQEIEKTVRVIRHCMKYAFKDAQADTYQFDEADESFQDDAKSPAEKFEDDLDQTMLDKFELEYAGRKDMGKVFVRYYGTLAGDEDEQEKTLDAVQYEFRLTDVSAYTANVPRVGPCICLMYDKR